MKIEEYLYSLEKKELIYIFISIPIVVFIIYYNFVYPNLDTEYNKLTKKQKSTTKELYTISSKIRKVKSSKNILLPTRKKLENLKEDYRYISYSFDTLDFVKLNDKKIYNILTQLLNKAKFLDLSASFDVSWNKKQLHPFTQYVEVTITGSGDYISILKYLQFIDHIRALINVASIKIAISLDEKKDIKDTLKKEKKAESSSVSFILTKYSENTLRYLKSLAKSKKLDLSISVNSQNTNYLNIGFKGEYVAIKNIVDILKDIQKRKNKPFNFTKLRANLKFVNSVKHKKNTQQFRITLEIVGVK